MDLGEGLFSPRFLGGSGRPFLFGDFDTFPHLGFSLSRFGVLWQGGHIALTIITLAESRFGNWGPRQSHYHVDEEVPQN